MIPEPSGEPVTRALLARDGAGAVRRGAGLVLAAGLAAAGCAPPAEVRVGRLLEHAEQVAEQGDLRELATLVSARYEDDAGRDRSQLIGLVGAYLSHGRSVHLWTKIDSIAIVQPDRADLVLYLAVAATPISGLPDLADVRADLLRVELQLADERGDWRLIRAEWRPARMREFL